MGLGVRERGKGRNGGSWERCVMRGRGHMGRRGVQGDDERRGVIVGRGGRMHNGRGRGHWKARGARGVMRARVYGKAKEIWRVMGCEGLW